MKKLITILTALMLVILFSLSCQKQKGPEEKKEAQGQKVDGMQASAPDQKREEKLIASKKCAATEEEQKRFKGGLFIADKINEITYLKSLKILHQCDYDTIRWYGEWAKERNMDNENQKARYVDDTCITLAELAKIKSKTAYNEMLDIMRQKIDYPKIRACAAEAIGWYGELKNGKWVGDKRSIPALKGVLIDNNPEIRLQAAGTLLSLGEADIALPVLDDLVKLGIHQSTFALNKLFAVEELAEDGKKRVVVSHTKLWDERGENILVKALNYQSDEVNAFAAVSLAQMGIEKMKVEKVALQIVEKLKSQTMRDYGFDPQKGVPTTDPKAEPYYSDGRSCTHAMYALKIFKSHKATSVLDYIRQNNKEWWFVCKSREAE